MNLPDNIADISKEDLVQLYVDLGTQEEQVVAAKVIVREEIIGRMKRDGEVIGNYQVTRYPSYSFSDVSVEQAKELGAVDITKSASKLKALVMKGVDIPHTKKMTLRVMEIKDKEIISKGGE